MTASLPLRRGERGEAVRDLQRRLLAVHSLDAELGALGADVAAALGNHEAGWFGPHTERAVRAFQARFGLDVHGVCDDLTWAMLVEAGYRLGDRQLYHRAPMMRGEDVADLQRRLGALGFDAGRADGIFGPRTASAVAEFQRNSGLASDGICGPDTVAALQRLGPGRTDAVPVAVVREREHLRCAPRHLPGRRIVLGHPGGLGPLVQTAHRLLRETGAHVLTLHHPDGSVQAQHANGFGADVFVAVRLADEPGVRTAYFRGTRFESGPGRRLAQLVLDAINATDASDEAATAARPAPIGMRLPILRETRMPAVLVEIGPPGRVVTDNERLARCIVHAIEEWVDEPLPTVV